MKTNLLNLHIAQRAPERVAPRITWSLAASAAGRPVLRASWALPATVPNGVPVAHEASEGVAA